MPERTAVLVVGGGQAGLAASYYLAQAKVPHLVLDAEPRAGNSWRRRWDSLELFSNAAYSALAVWQNGGNWARTATARLIRTSASDFIFEEPPATIFVVGIEVLAWFAAMGWLAFSRSQRSVTSSQLTGSTARPDLSQEEVHDVQVIDQRSKMEKALP